MQSCLSSNLFQISRSQPDVEKSRCTGAHLPKQLHCKDCGLPLSAEFFAYFYKGESSLGFVVLDIWLDTHNA